MTVFNKFPSRGVKLPAHGRVGKKSRCGPTRSSINETPHQKMFRIASLNVGTLRSRSSEVVETVSRRGIDLCCIQEVRWRGASARMVEGKDTRYKVFWVGNNGGTAGVGILLSEEWVEKVYEVNRISDRLMLIKLAMDKVVLTVLSCYAPQVGLDDTVKDAFYDQLQNTVAKVSASETLIICGDFNGHIGKLANGYEGIHGGHGYGDRNIEGERILEFAVAHNLVVGNSYFTKKDNHLITYQSGGFNSQIDYILVRRSDFKLVRDMKVIPGEEVVTQHRLLVCDMKWNFKKEIKKIFVPKLRVWKLKDPEFRLKFNRSLNDQLAENGNPISVEEKWKHLKNSLLKATEKSCGFTKKGNWRKQTWWWDESVSDAVNEKRRLWKIWKSGGSRERYVEAKRVAKQVVFAAKKKAEKVKLKDVEGDKQKIFRIAKQMRMENKDIIGEKCIRDDNGNLALSEAEKKKAWKEHYERLLNVEFAWLENDLSPAVPVQGPPLLITQQMVDKSIKKMKSGKAPGPTGIVAEMLLASSDICSELIADLANAIIRDGEMPDQWNGSYIISLFKGKGEALDRSNYRGLKLTEHVLKVLERIVEELIRNIVHIDDMQFGFIPGRGTIDAIFILRQMQEKYLEKNRNLFLAFVDLEKAFDRVPRKVIWWAMRKVEVPEWIVKLVQILYQNARSQVRVNNSYSDVFNVKVGVHQGSVLSPLLFIIVLEALSQEFRTGCPWEILYADDLVIIAESMDEMLSKLKRWKEHLEAKGLRVNMGKTKVLISGKNLESLTNSGKHPCSVCRKGVGSNSIFCEGCQFWVHNKCSGIKAKLKADPSYRCKRCLNLCRTVDGRPTDHVMLDDVKIDVVESFRYLGDEISPGGGSELTTIARSRAAWSKFRELLPLLTSRSISLERRGELYDSCVRGALFHASETWALRADDVARLKRNERAMLRWLCGVKADDRGSTSALYSLLKISPLEPKLRLNRLRWYGHVQRSNGWIKRCSLLEVDGNRGRGRPSKTWNGTVMNDLKIWNIDANNVHDRNAWKKALRTVMKSPTHGNRGQVAQNG